MNAYTTRRIDLNDLDPHDPLWDTLMNLTLGEEGCAREIFDNSRSVRQPIGAYVVLIVTVCDGADDGRVVAWGAKFKDELHAFTHPDYRGRGVQRDLVMPFWAKECPKLIIQTVYLFQQQMAKYYYGVSTAEETNEVSHRRLMASFEPAQAAA